MNIDILLYIIIILIPVLAQVNISLTYRKYKEKDNSQKLSGFEVARKILDENGLSEVYVVETPGELTDHYDPSRKVIKLSKDIFNGISIASASVAAHECGHAIQDKTNYSFMRIRSFIFPIVSLVSKFSWIVIFIGLLTQIFQLFMVGIALISLSLVFQLVTLPVEFDASKRAKEELVKLNLIGKDEDDDVKKMLTSAALTYVASVLTSILELLRLFLLFNDNRR